MSQLCSNITKNYLWSVQRKTMNDASNANNAGHNSSSLHRTVQKNHCQPPSLSDKTDNDNKNNSCISSKHYLH